MTTPVEIELLGAGAFAGARANVVSYSATEGAVSFDLSESGAGIGGITFEVTEDPSFDGSVLLPGEPFRLTDPHAGVLRGIIDDGTVLQDTTLSVDGTSHLLPLVSTRSLPAVAGTLGAAILQYFIACGMDGTNFQIDPDIGNIPVALPAWTGEVWVQLKKLQAIHQFEIAVVDNTVVVRKPRLRFADVQRYASKRIGYSRAGAYQSVEVAYYNNRWAVNEVVYPQAETPLLDRSIISVNAGEVLETNLPVDMWISSIMQPVQALSLPDGAPPSTGSFYSVVDSEGIPVSLFDWKNGGGSVTAKPGEDGRSIDLKVQGMITNQRAPYRIAASSADREYQYSTLSLSATGVAFKEERLWAPTGASLVDAPVDSVLNIEENIVSTRAQAEVVLMNAVLRHAGWGQALEAEATHINRRGEVGAILPPSFGDWDAENAGYTFAVFDSQYAGETFRHFDAEQVALVADDFANQAFGGMAGARVRDRDNIYRIESADASPGSISWMAQSDVLFSDWESAHSGSGMTFGQFDAFWSGKTFAHHARMPLAVP